MAGIYIHIPFCRQACNYCNFHFSVSLKNKENLINNLIKEINISNDFIANEEIETVYFGGGTPSLLRESELQLIFNSLHTNYQIKKDAEITIEANPDDINDTTIQSWKKLGFNRLSVGLQSFNEAELKWMNRAHNATQSLKCLDDIQQAGFTNYSVDLIYGSPLQSNQNLKNNFEIIAQKKVPHISCYALTVEPGTKLNQQIVSNKTAGVDSEKQAEQFYLLLQMMEKAGYEQYEISNFCLPGYRSKHNSSYWQGKPYHGFGPSAHSYNGSDKRRWNIGNNGLYIKALEQDLIPFEEEILTKEQRINEYVMTALRTMEGVNMGHVANLFGPKYYDQIHKAAQKYLESGRLILQTNHLQLSKEGKFFADGIASDLFI